MKRRLFPHGGIARRCNRQTAERLTAHPFIGRRGDFEGTRELMLHRNYLLTCRVGSEAVEILQIWYVAQKRYH